MLQKIHVCIYMLWFPPCRAIQLILLLNGVTFSRLLLSKLCARRYSGECFSANICNRNKGYFSALWGNLCVFFNKKAVKSQLLLECLRTAVLSNLKSSESSFWAQCTRDLLMTTALKQVMRSCWFPQFIGYFVLAKRPLLQSKSASCYKKKICGWPLKTTK